MGPRNRGAGYADAGTTPPKSMANRGGSSRTRKQVATAELRPVEDPSPHAVVVVNARGACSFLLVRTTLRPWPARRANTADVGSIPYRSSRRSTGGGYLVLREHLRLGASGAFQPLDLKSEVRGESSRFYSKNTLEIWYCKSGPAHL